MVIDNKINYGSASRLKTPVLFIVFNRPEQTELVFDAIRKVQPQRLYIAADGPRHNYDGEEELCLHVREIATAVDWHCEVKTLFRESNVGCATAMGEAVKWFFEHEEEGIILEDDCLPSESLFPFCEELLEKYKDDERVGSIIGRNELGAYDDGKDTSYLFFSRYSSWGSATWRHKYEKLYKPELGNTGSSISDREIMREAGSLVEYLMLRKMLKAIRSGRLSSYAWPLSLSHKINRMVVVCPKVNLITNIGYGSGTHTLGKKQDNVDRHEIEFPLKHPSEVKVNWKFVDAWVLKFINGFPRLLVGAYPKIFLPLRYVYKFAKKMRTSQ